MPNPETASRFAPFRFLFTPLVAAAIAFVLGCAIFAAYGRNPLSAYWVMFQGAFGSGYLFSEVLVKTTPLVLTGLAVALAARMLLWNIGCEGQYVLGCVFSTGFALYVAPNAPAWLLMPGAVLAGALGGGLWALIPALLKVRFKVNEILVTLLLNYVAIQLMDQLYFSTWRDPEGRGFPGTAAIPKAAELPRFFGSRVHLVFFLALAAAVAIWFVLGRTRWGYKLRVIGQSPGAAKYAGFSVNRHTIAVLCASGMLAGLAGVGEILGLQHRLQEGVSVGYGYAGIVVAFLGGLNPLGVVFSAFALAALMVGGEQLQSVLGLPASISLVLEAGLLFGYLTGSYLSGRKFLPKAASEPEPEPEPELEPEQDAIPPQGGEHA